ncbi:MAG TPA: cytochrome d ubiquinol oxidase subunit II [Candidatus Merdimorpha stercoravium]|uniref:Cytochrome d ubiquinol oxidase subunit II n=1 Tax=Candidatus Merdimorpha stercoravium TaxID=2840863 RepID=A0A9D1H9H1_9FLAO|nr:cytochrome d ubiquinol oxidase subunit II [Candidatus Merdimorpha stercoravium]
MFETFSTFALQQYWWVIISLLAGLLVALMFVQGGQTLIYQAGNTDLERTMIVNALGHKWELTFTTLVVFGGAFFAAFPLFYATSFGGAYWVWMVILLFFVLQAVSYEFRTKAGNLLGQRTYQNFLLINGIGAPLFLGVAVASFFTGSSFVLLSDPASGVLTPRWTGGFGGLELAFDLSSYPTYINLSLGIALVFLTRVLGAMYLKSSIDSPEIAERASKTIRQEAPFFLLFFVFFLLNLLLREGYAYDSQGLIYTESFKYLHNLLQMPLVLVLLLLGTGLTLAGIVLGGYTAHRRGFYYSAPGVVLVVLALLLTAGLNNTVYYPSTGANIQNGLTIRNSSSGRYTLTVMSYVSLFIPFVVAYIAYVWHSMGRHKIDKQEIKDDPDAY